MTGDITFVSDKIRLDNTGLNVETLGDIILKPYSADASIGVSGGSGTLDLSDTHLGYFSPGTKLVIGDAAAGTGAVDIDGWDLSGAGYDVEIYGGYIGLDGTLTGGGGTLALITGGTFTNNAGASAINAGTGRYLIYADHPDDVARGGLEATSLYNRTYTDDPLESIDGTGDHFVYSYQPTLTLTADDRVWIAGEALSALTYAVSGVRAEDADSWALSTAPRVWRGSQRGKLLYDILISGAASDAGYAIEYVTGTLEKFFPESSGIVKYNGVHSSVAPSSRSAERTEQGFKTRSGSGREDGNEEDIRSAYESGSAQDADAPLSGEGCMIFLGNGHCLVF